MKRIETPNSIKIVVVFILSLIGFIVGFFLRGNSNFTIPIAMLTGALLLYLAGKIIGLFYEQYKNKSKILALMGVFGVSAIFVGIVSSMLYAFHLVSISIVINKGVISLVIGFILLGISYLSLKNKKKIKPLIIVVLTLFILTPSISIKAYSVDIGESYINQNSFYGINISNVQFQQKAEQNPSQECVPVTGKISPNKQKSPLTEINITPQIVSQKTVDDVQFQDKLSRDIKLNNITNYANNLGYTPFKNGTQEITYDNGVKAIIAPMELKNKSQENKAVYIASFSKNDVSNFSFIAEIKNENGMPTITMFNEEGGVVIDLINGTIISEWGHHSCSYWLCMGHCAFYYIFVGTLGYFCKGACTACIGLPGPWTCAPCIACLIVFAVDCQANCYSDNCYWYPCQEDCSDENYCESFVYYCSGDNRRKHRLCHELECNTEIPGESGSCVDESGSPSWQDDTFVETCTYGCNEVTGNCQGAVTCYDDPDCGDDGWVGSTSCSGGNVWQDWREYTCYNSGTENSYCDYDDTSTLKQICSGGECSGGECQESSSCEDPDYPWLCNEGCWGCELGNKDRSVCCPDSGDPELCCLDVGPYCDSSSGECTVCGGDYPWECNDGCWGCPDGGELCCPTSGDPDYCCRTEIGAVCMSDGDCCLPSTETCNNQDDDCDEVIDSFSEGCGVGACAGGTRTCTAGSWGSCSTDGLSTGETCNNIDDDCDGSVDESLSQECGTDDGACVKGTQTCSSGSWGECGGSYVGPTSEECNDIDDNCNNITDEQNVCNNDIIINLEFPENNTIEHTNPTPTFGFNITNVNYTYFNCSLWLDNGTPTTYANDSVWINTGNSWNITANRTIPEGVYHWWINCTDGVNFNISKKRIITMNLVDDPPSISLLSPLNSNTSATGNLIFNCSATDDNDLDNITLYHNISGIWQANETKVLTDTSDFETFTVNNIPDDTNFIWNCVAYDNASQSGWGSNNYTASVNIPQSNITVSSLQKLYSNSTYYIFEFIILNNGDTTLSDSSWQFDTGNNETINSDYNFTLDAGESIYVFLEYNYSSTGSYTAIANATSGNLTASRSMSVTIANQTNLDVYGFSVLNQDATLTIFGFSVNNTGDNATEIDWSLDTGEDAISSETSIDLESGESVFVFAEYNYSATGDYTAVASATDGTYPDSETITIDVPDIEVSSFSVLNVTNTIGTFGFIIENTLPTNLTNVSWIFDTKDGDVINSTYTVSLEPDEEMFVYLQYNFSTTGTFNVNASVKNGTLVDFRNLTVTI